MSPLFREFSSLLVALLLAHAHAMALSLPTQLTYRMTVRDFIPSDCVALSAAGLVEWVKLSQIPNGPNRTLVDLCPFQEQIKAGELFPHPDIIASNFSFVIPKMTIEL
jgi:hypothetical protein